MHPTASIGKQLRLLPTIGAPNPPRELSSPTGLSLEASFQRSPLVESAETAEWSGTPTIDRPSQALPRSFKFPEIFRPTRSPSRYHLIQPRGRKPPLDRSCRSADGLRSGQASKRCIALASRSLHAVMWPFQLNAASPCVRDRDYPYRSRLGFDVMENVLGVLSSR